MTSDWHEAYSAKKPPVIDTTSSPTTVYIRKDFEEVEIEDPMNEGEPTKQWKYLERTCTHEEYAIARLSSDLSVENIQIKHESDIIDEYTLSLIEEGLL